MATFTSEQLSNELVLEGHPELQIELKADQPGFDLAVALSRLPAGSSQVDQLSTGVYRCLGENALECNRHRVLLQPARQPPTRRSIAPLDCRAAWPAIGVNPGTSKHSAGAPARSTVVTMTLELAGSALELIPLDSSRLTQD